jgi:DNA polymerase-3 subunit gamma/tau
MPIPVDAASHVDAWRAIVERVRAARPPLASVLEHAIPIEIGAARVTIGFDSSAAFLAVRAGEPDALEVLTREVRGHFDAPTEVELRTSTQPSNGVRTVAAIDADRRAADLAKARDAVERHPLVQEAIRLFGAQLRDVRLPGRDG